ncbi:MAG: glycosyltransferase family 2 protein [Lachnospiraceae bacterium]|nr:glycosyltransferase family 2 protein [Lachnospiraceae bacterium]
MRNKYPLVSVIIPVYNVEMYLERCIKSILNQSYKYIEIVLVDDGSTDSSGLLCDKFANLDKRIRVIHKRNGGLSDARNAALDIISGSWVTFVDSDDWVDKDYVKEMLLAAEGTKSAIAAAVYINVKDEEKNNKKTCNKKKIKVLDNAEAVEALLYQRYYTTAACCKLFSAKLWRNVRFPVGKLYEDVHTVYEVFKKANKVAFLNKVLYFYFQRSGSIVREQFSLRKMDYVTNCNLLLRAVETDYPKLKNGAVSRLLWAELHLLIHMNNYENYKSEYTMLWKDIKKYRKIILLDPKCRLKNKIVLLLSYGGDKVLKNVYRITKV